MIQNEELKKFAAKRVVITGGTGLIGRQVTSMLCEAGASVQVVSLDHVSVDSRAEHTFGNLSDFELCKEVTRSADFVFHLAGIKGSINVTRERPASFLVPLLMMNTNVLEACRINSVPRVVYTSSIGAYASAEVFREGEHAEGPPMDTYPGWAKRIAELQVKAYEIQYGLDNFAVVRPCNVYGPGDNFDPENAMVIPSLMARIIRGENPVTIWGDGSAVRDFAYSRDVAEGVILACLHGTGGGFVNLGSGKGYSIRELVDALHAVTPFHYEFDESKAAGFPRRVMDISLARKLVNYNPTTSLQQGLQETWDWFTTNQNEHTQKVNYFTEGAHA